jgi:fructokinase
LTSLAITPTRPAPILVGLGEVLWDIYPDVSHFGGAPANFACHASALGARASIVSAVGDDHFGRLAKAALEENRVAIEFLQIDRIHPTGTVQVTLDQRGQASYAFASDTAWDFLKWNESLRRLASECDAVCFGTLGQRSETSRETIQQFVLATPEQCCRVFDVNLRQNFYTRECLQESMKLATVLKLNDTELPVVCDLLGVRNSSDRDALRALSHAYSLGTIALTRGSQGSLLFSDGDFDEAKPLPVDAIDTVGAGDAFTASMILGIIQNEPLASLHQHATRVAAYVCTQRGATPKLPPSLGYF